MSAIGKDLPGPDLGTALSELAGAAQLRRVEMVAWRDLGHPEAGGSELHATRVAERWAQAGVDVTMKASRAPASPPVDSYGGFRVTRPGRRYGVFPTVAWEGFARRSKNRPDGLVEIWNGLPFLSPLWAGCARTVFLHHVHEGMWDLTLPAPLAAAGRLIEVRIAPRFYRSTPIVTLSESSRQRIIQVMGLDPAQIRVVEPGVDPRYSPLGPRSERPFFVAVGRLMPYKRFDLLIDALVATQATHESLEAVIVGEGQERAALQARIDAHGAGGWLRMTGHLDGEALLATYRRAWAVLSASAFEGWGMTLTEAAACGTPAVASRIAGHSDAVHDGTSGLLFDDREQLEGALRSLIDRPDLRRRLQSGAAQRALALTWDRTALGTMESLAADAIRRNAGALGAIPPSANGNSHRDAMPLRRSRSGAPAAPVAVPHELTTASRPRKPRA